MLAIAIGLWRLEHGRAGLTIERLDVGGTPATLFAPAGGPPGPVVVIAHGFAGSQQLMQPFALTLARDGYRVLTFDFPGHGRNEEPLQGGLTDDARRSQELLAALDGVVAAGRALSGGSGRLALLGHSMASDIVIQYARAHPEIAATVAVSPFARDVEAGSPRNLLVVIGSLEPPMLLAEGRRIVGMASGGMPDPETTYGRFEDGTARRLALAPGVEHIGVLYSPTSMREARDWLDATFQRSGSGRAEDRGLSLALLFGGLLLIAPTLSRMLPVVVDPAEGAGLQWHRMLPLAIVPALLTPLLLLPLPTGFLPILLGDYLAAHFLVYGILTGLGLLWAGLGRTGPASLVRFLVAAVLVTAYATLVLGAPLDRYLSAWWPTAPRIPLILALLCGTLPYFAADEWLTRGSGAGSGRWAVTKVCFLLSLGIAVALSPERLYFLVVIVPAIVILFVAYGVLADCAYRRTGHPLVGAVANAVALAWAIGVTFPVVGGS